MQVPGAGPATQPAGRTSGTVGELRPCGVHSSEGQPMRMQGARGLPRPVRRSLRHHVRRLGTSSPRPRPASPADTRRRSRESKRSLGGGKGASRGTRGAGSTGRLLPRGLGPRGPSCGGTEGCLTPARLWSEGHRTRKALPGAAEAGDGGGRGPAGRAIWPGAEEREGRLFFSSSSRPSVRPDLLCSGLRGLG